MTTNTALTHPIRLRIVMSLVGEGRQLTTAQIAESMPDVAAPSLYRHIATLLDAGIIEVVSERRVRGAVERTLALKAGAANVDQEGAATMTAAEKGAAFGVYCAGLLATYEGYLASPDLKGPLEGVDWSEVDWPDDRADVGEAAKEAAGYRTLALYLDAEDLKTLSEKLKEAVAPYLEADPAKQRALFSTVFIPS